MKILSELSPDSGPLHIVGHADLCALFDISPAALSELKKRGIAVHVGRDRYDLTLTTRAYIQHLRGMAAGWGTGDDAGQLTSARARLAKEQADGQAIKNAKMRGELVEAAEVERTWTDFLRQLRARLTAIPARVMAERPETDPEVIKAIDGAVRAALTDLGNGN